MASLEAAALVANNTVAREATMRTFMKRLPASPMSEIARDNSSAQRRSVYGNAGERRRRWKNQQMRQHYRPYAPESSAARGLPSAASCPQIAQACTQKSRES